VGTIFTMHKAQQCVNKIRRKSLKNSTNYTFKIIANQPTIATATLATIGTIRIGRLIGIVGVGVGVARFGTFCAANNDSNPISHIIGNIVRNIVQ
jgi:hypothetical protein